MPKYAVLDEVYVPFQPTGLIADMDLSKAVLELSNGTEWVYGTLGKETSSETQPAFEALSLNDGLLQIEVYDTKDGKALNKLLDEGVKVRFGCEVLFHDDPEVPSGFRRFFADISFEQVEVKSDVFALPGVDFDVDKVLES